ncbi:MAG: hypothetical protein M1828_002924 [Chrysothrix sp. TS-e1954]|nr:MAG: hypothetical protein M1828_002924 [Chrysothrix sp. TS-e1954]
MAMLTPVAQYAPHDMTPEQMSPLSLSASELPPIPRSKATLPSLASLNLITPPHSAGQTKEDSFRTMDHESQGDDLDMRLMPDPQSPGRSTPPLFLEPHVNTLRYGPARSFEQALSEHRSPYEQRYLSGDVEPPTRTQYVNTMDFAISFRPAFKEWIKQEKPAEHGGDRKRRRIYPTTHHRQAVKDEYSHDISQQKAQQPGFKAINNDDSFHQSAKRTKSTPAKAARISSTPILMDRPDSEVLDLETTPKRTPKKRGSSGSTIGSREPKHARNKSTKVKRSSDHRDYTDYAPSFDTMIEPLINAQKVRALEVKNPIDLENDILKDELHEAELIAAKRLNISASVYLCTKRQIFEGYVQHLGGSKQGNWNKTAAQNAVNLDVTKASALWQFYNEIGWFDKDLFVKYLVDDDTE